MDEVEERPGFNDSRGPCPQETLNILNLVPLRQRNIGTALQDK